MVVIEYIYVIAKSGILYLICEKKRLNCKLSETVVNFSIPAFHIL